MSTVDDVGAFVDHPAGRSDGHGRVTMTPPVRERVVSNVKNAHDQRTFQRQPKPTALPEGGSCGTGGGIGWSRREHQTKDGQEKAG